MRRSWLAALPALAVLLAGCTSAPAVEPLPTSAAPVPSATPQGLAKYYKQTLDWQDCGALLQCTTLTVPKDYDDLSKGDLKLAVKRRPAEHNTKGTLFYNPGGPGGRGSEYVDAAPYLVSPEILDAYDFVSFDPRGVGSSEGIDCLTDKQQDQVTDTDPAPTSPEAIREVEKDAQTFAAACAKNAADIVDVIDSESVVKDMDVMRAALGEPRLNYLGESYGTKLGALYADEFGPKVGRMVLDGVMPPDLTNDQIAEGQAKGFDDALRQFVEWCQKERPDCPVAGADVDAGIAKIQAWLAKLRQHPMKTSGRDITVGLGLQGILYLLYSPHNGDWQELASVLGEAFQGKGDRFLSSLDTRMERSPNGTYAAKGNQFESLVAVTCLDGPSTTDLPTIEEHAKAWQQEAPVFGSTLAWAGLVCKDWPAKPKDGPRVVTGSEAGPIVVVGTTHDPATPYEWAQHLVQHMADAHLVTFDGNGHTGYNKGSECVDSAVNDYLLEGTLPADDLRCS